MKIRRNSRFISCVLFSIALLCLIPSVMNAALAGRDKVILERLDPGFRAEAESMSNLGIASLAIILIGLIVLWTGYVKGARAAWLVMFVIVWAWAFPLFVLPVFKSRAALTFSELFYSAIYQSGITRVWAKSFVIFLLMLMALLLPVRSFFLATEPREPSGTYVGFSALGVLMVLIALLAWIHLRVYEIPVQELNVRRPSLPAPPPPPSPPCKAQ